MRPSDVLGIAFAQIRGNPLRSFFTLLGIIVSVAFLVAVVAIIQGMNAYVKENIADAMVGANTFQVRRTPIQVGMIDDELMSRIRRRPRISEADAATVKAAMAEISKSFPRGLEYRITYNPTEFVEVSINELYKGMDEAVILVVIVVLLFLQTWRVTKSMMRKPN